MDPKDVVMECAQGLPQFSDGRIDFSDAEICPVVNVIVIHDDEILILKRSSKVSTHKNMWDCVGGYMDELISPEKKAAKELKEELGISSGNMMSISSGEPFRLDEKEKRWIVFPVMVELRDKPDISLDWEHTEYAWIKKSRIEGFRLSKKIKDILYRCTVKHDDQSS